MRCYIVIPAHNEEAYLASTLDSLIEQTLLPAKIIVVNDHSTDTTGKIIDSYSERFEFITGIHITSGTDHTPGSKVVDAFYKGYAQLDSNFDIICKFDADLIFPKEYLEKIVSAFNDDTETGMAGGFCSVEKGSRWVREELTGKDHIRGALKAYRKDCFQQIGGLKKAMGWDTIDELLAQYHGWKVCTIPELEVKHLKPTGAAYAAKSGQLQGKAFKRMRYGFLLTAIAAAKLALKKRKLGYFFDCLNGFLKDHSEYLVSPEEGRFIRKYRWKKIWKKLF